MARIKNIELPNEKHTWIGLTAIYGIGPNLGKTICKDANVEATKKIKDLTEEEIAALRKEVDKHTTEGDLRREVQMNIKNKMEINSYQGIRHKKGLPVRGQSTKNNARTRKGRKKTVAITTTTRTIPTFFIGRPTSTVRNQPVLSQVALWSETLAILS
jgi:small subunit ribosomal protein S13